MKSLAVTLIIIGMFTAQAVGQKKSALTSKKDKVSYSIGMSIAKNLKNQSYDVAPELVAQGLKDYLLGNKTLLTGEECDKVVGEYQSEIMAKQQEKNKQHGATNMKEGEEFLAMNKKKPGIITLPSGLQYKIITAGTGPKPTLTQTVTINYRGTLINGKEFDSSYKGGKPLSYPVNQFIKGWVEALQMMPVGSKWQLFIPSNLAYGERGMGADIGPNATLLFDIELLAVK